MNKLQRARWNNAKKIGNKIKSFIDKGFIVYDEDEEVVHDIIINDEGVFAKVSDKCQIMLFLNDTELDNGMYTPIKEFNETFEKWSFVDPNNKQPLFN
jgi:hypothetical protein